MRCECDDTKVLPYFCRFMQTHGRTFSRVHRRTEAVLDALDATKR
jgi:hypothetical protein